jgi:hypothetical protein
MGVWRYSTRIPCAPDGNERLASISGRFISRAKVLIFHVHRRLDGALLILTMFVGFSNKVYKITAY